MFVAFLLCVALVWLGGIFYAMRKGLNELITGLASIDQRLARLESIAAARRDGPPASPLET